MSFVTACLRHAGLRPEQARTHLEAWRQAWRRLSAGTANGPTPPDPAQLPVLPHHFTGRDRYLARLDSLLLTKQDGATVVAVVGQGGVGKTALVVRWAHRVADRFPDGQLYIDLHGYHAGPAMQTARALHMLLSALGVRANAIPSEVESCAALLRTVLTGKRMLVILDNARDTGQVRALLPGDRGCFTIVTSRDKLAGLVTREGAHRVQLDPLPARQAVELLALIVGEARVQQESQAARQLVRLCDGLPLAVRVAAHHAADGPRRSLADLVHALSDSGRRLDILSIPGDPLCTVRAVFDCSYRALPPDTRRVFRLLSLHPGVDCTVPSVAALAGLSTGRALTQLTTLLNGHLVQRDERDRYSMHDLVGVYSREQLTAEESPQEASLTLTRCLNWYQGMVISLAMTLDAHGHREPAWRASAFPAKSGKEALAWGKQERANIVAAVALAAEQCLWEWVRDTAVALAGFYSVSKYAHDWITVAHLGLRASEELHDTLARARLLTSLGNAHLDLARVPEAAAYFAQALPLRDACGNLRGKAITLNSLAITERRLGHPDIALGHLNQALKIQRQHADRSDEANTLINLGNVHRDLARYDEALAHLHDAYRLLDQLNEPRRQCIVLVSIGETYQAAGALDEAVSHHRHAAELATRTGDEWQAAMGLAELGYCLAAQGDLTAAVDAWQRALPAFAARADPRESELRKRLRETGNLDGDESARPWPDQA